MGSFAGTRWCPISICTLALAQDLLTASSDHAAGMDPDRECRCHGRGQTFVEALDLSSHFIERPWEATDAIAFSTSSWSPR